VTVGSPSTAPSLLSKAANPSAYDAYRGNSMRNQRNSNWGQSYGNSPITNTSFEAMVKQLKLSEKEYRNSIPLKEWAQKHKDSKYVPQDLLEAWGIEAKVD
jgi:hypothetical protein